KFSTSVTATARRPSTSGRYFGEGWDNGALTRDRCERRATTASCRAAFSSRSAAACHFLPRRQPKIRSPGAQNQPSNRAFRERQNQSPETLKKGKKSPFIQ